MEYKHKLKSKRRRMIKSEIDRLLQDEGTRNLLSGFKLVKSSSSSNSTTTTFSTTIKRTRPRLPKAPTNTTGGGSSNSSSGGRVKSANGNSGNNKTKKIIKKSLSLLGHSNKLNNATNNNNSTKIPFGGAKLGSSSANSGKVSNSKLPNAGGGAGSTNVKLTNGVHQHHPHPRPRGSSFAAAASSVVFGASSSSSSTTTATATMASYSTKLQNGNSSSLPLLATLVRGHVAFITLSYQNHTCLLRTQDLRDLSRKLEEYESRKGINVIVLNSSSDRIFCDGLDFKELLHTDLVKRKNAVQSRINQIKNVLNTLAKSKKILIASVNGGKVNGFGLILLGLFDMVYANDKATFSLQKYSHLKQPPEGISIFTQTQLLSPTMKSIVYMGRVCTASEMHQNGFLVTEVLWDGSRYHEQLASKFQNVNFQEHTKSVYKTYSSKNSKQISTDLTQELAVLETVWLTDAWQKVAVQQMHKERHS